MIDKITGYAALGDSGREFYESLHAEFEFDAAEELMVLEACHMVDAIRELETARARGLWISGPGRGDVLNPAFAELRQHRSQLITLLKKVGVIEDGRGKHVTSEVARRAVNVRWGN
ncbi:hypothetical protein [Pseudonocardia phyllosphaerae]|uniref:hypothetical protein n=1 Tax=Pseudonocardia phyllosphaerae TaxID=3390502 RepID=UPI003977FB04